METETSKLSFETAVNTKHRTTRLLQIIGIISPVIIGIMSAILTFTIEPHAGWSLVVSATGLFFMLIIFAASIDSDTIAPSEFISMHSIMGTITSVVALLFWIAQYKTPMGRFVLALPGIIIAVILAALAVLILYALTVGIYLAIKWISWNGYSENFIAITKSGNIKKFNNVQSIPEKLDTHADLTLVRTTLAKYKPELEKAGKRKMFW